MNMTEWLKLKAGDVLVASGDPNLAEPWCDGQCMEVLEVRGDRALIKHPDISAIWTLNARFYKLASPHSLDWRIKC